MKQNAEKSSFWRSLGCSVDTRANCGSVECAEFFKYLGVAMPFNFSDFADNDATLSRGRRVFKVLSKVSQ